MTLCQRSLFVLLKITQRKYEKSCLFSKFLQCSETLVYTLCQMCFSLISELKIR